MEKSFLYRRSFHLKFFQTGNKNFSENFHIYTYIFILAESLPAPEGTPHSCKHPIPPSTLGGDPCLTPNLGVHIPTPATAKSWEYRHSYPNTHCSKPLLSSHFMSFFVPFPHFKGQALAGTSPPCPHAQITRAVDFNFTSSGLS